MSDGWDLAQITCTVHDQQHSQKTRPCRTYQEVGLALSPLPSLSCPTAVCSLSQVVFKRPCSLRYITFQNYYTASIQVAVKQLGATNYTTVVENHKLMENSFFENDAQDWHTLDSAEWSSAFDCSIDVEAVKLVLRQPCPTWRQFGLVDIKCHRLTRTEAKERDSNETAAEAIPEHVRALSSYCTAIQDSLCRFREGKA